ncbi:MAG: class I SAM-dependent methyltransferase [Rubrobacter sp.]|nr:class I SAM-dependent methyltransferase [Rubrobacter sp.]
MLPELFERIGGAELFVHDSLHTYKNMAYELDLAWSHLPPGGVLLADDPERNAAFGELSGRKPELLRVIREIEDAPLAGPAARTTIGFAVK